MPEVYRNSVETAFFQSVDDKGAVVRLKLINEGIAPDDVTSRSDWARFLMSLQMRQPHVVNSVKKFASEILRREIDDDPAQYKALTGLNAPPNLLSFVEEKMPGMIDEIALQWYPKLVDHDDIGSQLTGLNWIVRTLPKGCTSFLISDHPCIYEGGIYDRRLIVALPLSPQHVFLGVRDRATAQRLLLLEPSELADKINRASFIQSRKRIYGADASATDFITASFESLGTERERVIATSFEKGLSEALAKRDQRLPSGPDDDTPR